MKTVKTNIIKFLFGITILCLCQPLTAQTDSVEVVVAERPAAVVDEIEQSTIATGRVDGLVELEVG